MTERSLGAFTPGNSIDGHAATVSCTPTLEGAFCYSTNLWGHCMLQSMLHCDRVSFFGLQAR